MKFGIIGKGKMSQSLTKLAEQKGAQTLCFGSAERLTAEPDLYLDFSAPSAVMPRLQELIDLKRPVLIGTTGWEEDLPHAESLVNNSGIAALYAPNFSIGMIRFYQVIAKANELFADYDAVGIDTHHKNKKDLPSGTAKGLQKKYGIPFSSVRVGSAMAKIEIFLDGPYETISLAHQVKSRDSFAAGALEVAQWLINQTGWKTLDDYLHSFNHSL